MLVERLKKERQEAANNNKVKRTLLTTLLGEAQNLAKRNGEELSDKLVEKLAQKFVDYNNEILAVRHDEKLVEENVILQEYAPKPVKKMSEDEIRVIIQESGQTDMKGIMGYLANNYKGQFDGKIANQIAKEYI